MVQVHDLNGAVEMKVGDVPYPRSAIPQHNHLASTSNPAPDRFRVDTPAKVRRWLDRSNVGSRGRIPYRPTFSINCRLSKNAPKLRLTRLGAAPIALAGSTLSLPWDHRHSCSV